jgi:CheY-like chemotaxis protein
VLNAFCRALRDTEYVARLEARRGAPRIVLVDGDPAALAVAELRLSAAGFSVKSIADGREAEAAILAEPPDAVVSEIALPRLDGISLLVKLRREAKTQAVPVFFVGNATGPTVTKALKLGATDVMAKPVSFDVLAAKLREATKKAAVASSRTAGDAKAGESGVFGTLQEFSLTDLLQVIAFGRKTATIHVESGGRSGRITLERGEPYSATTQRSAGPAAFRELTSWQQGYFRMEPGGASEERNLNGNLEALLLEALRHQDEAQAPTPSPA